MLNLRSLLTVLALVFIATLSSACDSTPITPTPVSAAITPVGSDTASVSGNILPVNGGVSTLAVTTSNTSPTTIQQQRWTAIAMTLAKYSPGYFFDQCKVFVSKTIKEATGVIVPSTVNSQIAGMTVAGGYSWGASRHFDLVLQKTRPIPTISPTILRPFDMIQAVIPARNGGWTPHTGYVLRIEPTGIWMKDANWGNDRTVKEHFIPFADMQRYYGMSIYRINGVL